VNKLNTKELGLVFGLALGLWHALWSLLVWLKVAQGIMNFILKLHMISLPFKVGKFNLMYAIELVVLTFVIGYVLGWLFGVIWNMCSKKRR
jgi:hypothetical protein